MGLVSACLAGIKRCWGLDGKEKGGGLGIEGVPAMQATMGQNKPCYM